MGKFITVVRFQFPHEAFVIKSKLESEGIEVILQDEQLIQVHNYLSNAIGGIKLQVKESDVTKALPIIKAAGLINSTNDVSDTNLQIWISKKLAKSPLLRQLSLANRLVLHLFILVVLFATLIFTFTLPTKEEKRIVQAEHEQFEAQLKFDQFYLPYADSLTANDPTKAITYIKELNELYPQNEYLYMNLGVAFFQIDSFQNAKNCFELSMRYSEYEAPLVLYDIAMCQIKLGDYDGALENLKAASEVNYDYWYDLANVYELKGDLEKAEYFYSIYLNRFEVKYGDNYFEVERKLSEIRELIKTNSANN